MKASYLFRAQAIVGGLFGIGFLIAPAALGSSYAGGVNATTELALRYAGAAFLSLGIVSWFAADTAPSPFRAWTARAFFVYAGLGALLALVGMSSGVMGGMGWLNVALGVIFLVGFGYYGFMKTDSP